MESLIYLKNKHPFIIDSLLILGEKKMDSFTLFYKSRDKHLMIKDFKTGKSYQKEVVTDPRVLTYEIKKGEN